jgi:hypothetical protein
MPSKCCLFFSRRAFTALEALVLLVVLAVLAVTTMSVYRKWETMPPPPVSEDPAAEMTAN